MRDGGLRRMDHVTQPDTMDDAIKALAKSVAQATIELAYERSRAGQPIRELYQAREEEAEALAEITLQCADEDPESEVHAVRAFGGGR